MRTHYRIDDFQQAYFVIDSFENCWKTATAISGRSMRGSARPTTSRPTN